MKDKFYTWKETGKAGIIIFLILAVISVPFYMLVDNGYYYQGDLRTREKQYALEEENTIDCLFIGDSETLATFSPLLFFHDSGFTSYNFGTVGQWAGDLPVITKYALKTQNPSLIVLDPNSLFLNVNDDFYQLSKTLPLFHYHEYFMRYSLQAIHANETKGFYLNTDVKPYEGNLDYMNQIDGKIITATSMKYLNEFLQICRENNVQLMVVNAPSALNWTYSKETIVQEWCDDNHIDYLDYNAPDKLKEIGIDWQTDTRDKGDHVNVYGSTKVCKDFEKVLKNKYSLPDHRNDSEYQSWEDLYQKIDVYQ